MIVNQKIIKKNMKICQELTKYILIQFFFSNTCQSKYIKDDVLLISLIQLDVLKTCLLD